VKKQEEFGEFWVEEVEDGKKERWKNGKMYFKSRCDPMVL